MTVPVDPSLDATLALRREGYPFIARRCRRFGTDAFRTRLMLRPVLCMSGGAASELFYGTDRFTRRGAMPGNVLKLLQDEGSVQQLDDAAHRHRKAMFMDLMSERNIERLRGLFREEWLAAQPRWRDAGDVVLLEEAQRILLRAAARWSGVDLPEAEVPHFTRVFAAMVEHAGGVGPMHWRARLGRRWAERRIRACIEDVRANRVAAPSGTALHAVAWHRTPEGELIDPGIATVELINVIRPIVAIAWFVMFAALALHEHPDIAGALADGEEEPFVQEVRRFYPFFPFIGGVARTPFHWHGDRFDRGQWVLFDIYGTNRDAEIWAEPERFDPERFRDGVTGAFRFVPQGGGDHHTGHRCPGEWITIALLKDAVHLLGRETAYIVPEQTLEIRLNRVPARAGRGFVLRAA